MKEYTKSDLNKVKRGPNRATYDIEKINNILDAGFVGFLGYIYDGQAISIPMAYGRLENSLILHGSLKNRMLLSLLESGKASMTIMHLDALVLARSGLHHSVNYRSATVFGSVSKVEDPTQKEIALERVINHMVSDRWEDLRPMTTKELNATLVVELKIATASAKVRDVGVLDEKSDESLPMWAGLVPIKQIAQFPITNDLVPDGIDIPQHVLKYYEENKV